MLASMFVSFLSSSCCLYDDVNISLKFREFSCQSEKRLISEGTIHPPLLAEILNLETSYEFGEFQTHIFSYCKSFIGACHDADCICKQTFISSTFPLMRGLHFSVQT